MSRLDDLPPDQRATLSLLLGQGKSYAQVAGLLSIEESAVRDRAHSAIAALAGGAKDTQQARELPPAREEEIGDYLLGQQTNAGANRATRAYLEGSAAAQAWARAIAGELAPLARNGLPEIPDGAGKPRAEAEEDAPRARPAPEGEQDAVAARPSGSPPSSRLGGALLLAVIVAGVIAAVVLIVGGGSSHSKSSASSSAVGTSSSKTSTTATGPTEDARLTLTSPDPTSKAVGVVEILSEGSKRAFYIAAAHLPPSRGFFYAIWLYNSPSSHQALSRAPPVGSNGRLEGGALLPANAGEYHQMLLTRETSNRPSSPGPTVLSGPFTLGR